jgi:hypothetical protein
MLRKSLFLFLFLAGPAFAQESFDRDFEARFAIHDLNVKWKFNVDSLKEQLNLNDVYNVEIRLSTESVAKFLEITGPKGFESLGDVHGKTTFTGYAKLRDFLPLTALEFVDYANLKSKALAKNQTYRPKPDCPVYLKPIPPPPKPSNRPRARPRQMS